MKKAFPYRIVLLGVGLLASTSWGANCLPLPMLAASRQGMTQLRLDVSGTPGMNYAIERSDDFTLWTPVATNRSSSGVTSFPWVIPPTASQQFFRAVSVTSADGLGGSFIFDGETFAGWEGDTVETFHIADCAIVGGSFAQSFPQNRFLCTTRPYTNFILRLEFKLVGLSGLTNSGVQFRSERVAGTMGVSGYQADMGGDYWGDLYEESRRGTLVAANRAAVAAVLRQNDWNRYVIQAEGPHIQLWLNDLQTVDYTEVANGIPQYGLIGLQVHAGGRFEASFRNISLEVLP